MKYVRTMRVVDAFKAGYDEEPEWFKMALACGVAWIEDAYGGIMIENEEVPVGDWIIKGINGELWHISPEEFEVYYEELFSV